MPAIHCHRCTPGSFDTTDGIPSIPKIVFPTTPLMSFDAPREDTARAYSI
jgi:hypothetical protein